MWTCALFFKLVTSSPKSRREDYCASAGSRQKPQPESMGWWERQGTLIANCSWTDGRNTKCLVPLESSGSQLSESHFLTTPKGGARALGAPLCMSHYDYFFGRSSASPNLKWSCCLDHCCLQSQMGSDHCFSWWGKLEDSFLQWCCDFAMDAHHKTTFFGLVTLTLTSELDLDSIRHDLNRSQSSSLYVYPFSQDSETDGRTDSQTMPKLLQPPLTRGVKIYHIIKELFLCFQKIVSGELHTFYFGRFPSPGIEPGSLESGT